MKKLLTMCAMVLLSFAISAGVTNSSEVQVQAKESTNYTIKVNLGTNCTTIYNKEGKAIKAMICSPSSETPTGTFYIPIKYRWHEMIGNCYAQYCSRIAPEVLFHSVWYYKNGDKSTMSVAAYNVMGQKASHGCVRLLCKDAKWIYDHCAVGTKIVIFWGSKKDDPLERPSFTPIRTGAFTSWDPTDPDENNPYMKKAPQITANVKNVEYGQKVKLTDLVTIKGSTGDILTTKNAKIKTKGKINTKKLGKYKVTYTVKDSLGNKKTQTITFKVVDTKKPILTGAQSKTDVAMGSQTNVLTGVKAKSVAGKNLTSKIKVSVLHKKKKVKVTKGAVTFTQKGKYKITYTVKGVNGKITKKTVTYKVTDQRVKFALKSSSVKIKQGSAFDPYSYVKELKTYYGDVLDIKKNVKYTGKVDTKKPGTYTLTYTAQNGNLTYTKRIATLKVTVEAVVVPTTKPAPPTKPEEITTPAETTKQEETTGQQEVETTAEVSADIEK